MPLHDWSEAAGWDGVHDIWTVELLRWIKPRLPEGYRAYIGTVPTVSVGAPPERADVQVRRSPAPLTTPPPPTPNAGSEPDVEIAVAALEEPSAAVYVERQHRLVAALELVSPRNKDRTAARATYLAKYVGYLLEGVHLMLVDVHPRPAAFSFADAVARELRMDRPPCPAPFAVSYRVGEPAATGGRLLALWQRALRPGGPLPEMMLPLTVEWSVPVDLEETYTRAAADAYLS